MRRKIIGGAILFAFALEIYATVTETRSWPFVPFNMYANGFFDQSQIYLEGVASDGSPFPLAVNSYFYPYQNWQLFLMLRRADRAGDAQLERILYGLKQHYARRRAQGLHNGKKIVSIRAYRITWKFEYPAANLLHPSSSVLLKEI